ncbi:complement C1q-like protein 4 isoform X2 [Centropristis striata]|uniref:complement C1q-like protein 4 isoform X2 n=1 Tax=Centropristis striata TaxID=184440 RepID=UPI0027E1B25F|nr:complement C1q-like protein 4 isoform X2 [Centropristis striata]
MMKVAESFLLLLLLAASSFMVKSSTASESHPRDVYEALGEMKGEIRHLHVENKEQASELHRLKKQQQEQAAKVQKQHAEMNKLKEQQQGRQVAFSVAPVTKGEFRQGPVNGLTTLIFKHVQTNIGNGYNKHTGVFTAPVRGAYHFEWHVGAHGDNRHPSAAVLIKNSEQIFMAWERQAAHFGTASSSVTLLLEVGDTVFLRLWYFSRVYDNRNHHNSFSGLLLFPM